jgi:hypothetical protein
MEPKGLMTIKDPEVAKLLSDELRRNVLHLVTHKEMRAPDIQLEPHVGKSIAHMLANVRLLKDQKHRTAAEELAKILGI